MITEMQKEIFEIPSILEKCYDGNFQTIRKLTSEILNNNIRFVYIVARGTSDHAGIYAKYAFESLLGIPVVMAAPSIVTMYNKDMCLNNALVIAISQSGEGQDIIQVMQNARKSNAILLTITNNENSPLLEISDFNLLCHAGEEKSVAATKTFFAELFLILCITNSFINNELTTIEIKDLKENIQNTLNMKNEIFQKAQRYRFLNECFILSRGIDYSIALETALKLQECTYVRAKAYSSSDFLHGPIAMIDNNQACFFIMNKGIFSNQVKTIINAIKDYGCDITVISNDRELTGMGHCAIEINSMEGLYSPLILSTVMQLFVCGLAEIKGLNPDRPRNLKKVTITV